MAGDNKKKTNQQKKAPKKTPQKTEGGLFNIDILSILKKTQSQHGVTFKDYSRYQSYCTKRIYKLRRQLHFTNGRGKLFQKKEIQITDITEPKFLLLALMLAERKWALAMSLKENVASNAEYASRSKHKMVNVLKKAVSHSGQLVHFCQQKAEKTTLLEAQAYQASLQGNLFLSENRWSDALSTFEQAKNLYEQLPKFKGTEYETLCKEKENELTPLLRFCRLNITGNLNLQTQASSTSTTTQTTQPVLNVISWKNKEIQVTNEKVKLFLNKAQTTLGEAEKAENLSQKLDLYDEAFIAFGDALSIVKDELIGLVSQKSEGNKDNLNNLLKYIEFQKLSKTVDRTLLMIESLEVTLASKARDKTEKRTKPEDLSKMYETLIQFLSELTDKYEEEDRTPFYKGYRCYYLSLVYIRTKKWNEALALLQRAEFYLSSVTDSQLYEKLQKTINAEKFEIHAKAFLAQSSTSTPSPQQTNLLSENPQIFSTRFAENKQIAHFPPPFEAIRCKPQLFDLALDEIPIPDLGGKPSDSPKTTPPKSQANEPAPSSSGWGSWFGWGKKE